jgi:ribosome biogenesis GTPase
MKGVVVKSTGSWYLVRELDGGQLYDCRIKGKFRVAGIKSTNPLAVGDFVSFEPEEKDEGQGIIDGIEDRKNYIIRKSVNLSKRVHIIAANMDQALLVTTLAQPATSTGFMDRFLSTAEAYNIPTIIVFNKCDLYDSEEIRSELDYRKAVYSAIGYHCLETSATKGEGLAELASLLKGKTTLLSGHSGVGKSTLINAIEPSLNLRTGAVSSSHNKGQHTTTFAEMHPLQMGGDIIDTPGIKGFGMVNMEKEEISHFFPELFALSKECRFHNCLHVNEPQCAVKEALEENKIAPTRYESYLNQLNDQDETTHYRSTDY